MHGGSSHFLYPQAANQSFVGLAYAENNYPGGEELFYSLS